MLGIRDNGLLGKYKCRIRVLDSFGTEPICKLLNTIFVFDVHNDTRILTFLFIFHL